MSTCTKCKKIKRTGHSCVKCSGCLKYYVNKANLKKHSYIYKSGKIIEETTIMIIKTKKTKK